MTASRCFRSEYFNLSGDEITDKFRNPVKMTFYNVLRLLFQFRDRTINGYFMSISAGWVTGDPILLTSKHCAEEMSGTSSTKLAAILRATTL